MLRLPARLLSRLLAEADGRPDEEICGLLAGRAGEAEIHLPVENALHSDGAFDMDPAGLIAAMRRIRESGRELVGIYHSHPHGPAFPSATDVASNQYPEVIHGIIGREEGEWRLRVFRLDGEVGELELRITAEE
ncbi:MAG TPA: M67 family metallopeptidase [Gammaproteobacteria bacterium]|nr:M67 family metallopeptidase [Gammaproteobacteria bacterium]